MRQRIDLLLVAKGFTSSRERAKRLIESGAVEVDGVPVLKPSASFEEDVRIFITGEDIPFVSRGGLKLEKALDCFDLDVKGLVCADIGASTGGFTDCLLSRGAAYVYSVDSGHDQLHHSLIARPEVINMEGVNARNLTGDDFERAVDFFAMDVSFISITKVLPAVLASVKDTAFGVCLIKPQFEAGRENIGKKGVVRDKKVHICIIKKIRDFCLDMSVGVRGLTWSPVRGPEGNIEYLIFLQKGGVSGVFDFNIWQTVEQAFSSL